MGLRNSVSRSAAAESEEPQSTASATGSFATGSPASSQETSSYAPALENSAPLRPATRAYRGIHKPRDIKDGTYCTVVLKLFSR